MSFVQNFKTIFYWKLILYNTGRQWRALDGTKIQQAVGSGRNRITWYQMRLSRHAWSLYEDDILQTMDRKSYRAQAIDIVIFPHVLSSSIHQTFYYHSFIHKPITFKQFWLLQEPDKTVEQTLEILQMTKKCKAHRPKSKVDLGLSTCPDMFFGEMLLCDFQATAIWVTLVQFTSIRAFKHSMNSSYFQK